MSEQLAETISYKKCAKCGMEGRADATLCGFCWSRLTALKPDDIEVYTRPVVAGSVWISEETARYDAAERRDCPKCGRRIMAAATLCGFCWSRLTPTIG